MFIVDCYNGVSDANTAELIEAVTDMQVLIINATGNITEISNINGFNVCIKYAGNGIIFEYCPTLLLLFSKKDLVTNLFILILINLLFLL